MCPKFSIGFLWDFPTNSLRLTATIIPSWLKIWTQWLDEDECDMKNYVAPIHPWGSSFWLLGGNKVCEILRIVPLLSVEYTLSFSESSRATSPAKSWQKWVRTVVFFFNVEKHFSPKITYTLQCIKKRRNAFVRKCMSEWINK